MEWQKICDTAQKHQSPGRTPTRLVIVLCTLAGLNGMTITPPGHRSPNEPAEATDSSTDRHQQSDNDSQDSGRLYGLDPLVGLVMIFLALDEVLGRTAAFIRWTRSVQAHPANELDMDDPVDRRDPEGEEPNLEALIYVQVERLAFGTVRWTNASAASTLFLAEEMALQRRELLRQSWGSVSRTTDRCTRRYIENSPAGHTCRRTMQRSLSRRKGV